jgi:hypothetical protein
VNISVFVCLRVAYRMYHAMRIYQFLQMFQINEVEYMHSKGVSSSSYKINPNNFLMGLGRKANPLCFYI